MNRYVCIHGHFYQPPRENVWLEAIEVQPSAYPYHDWNERITSECYWPNAASQILDNENRVVQIVNNYSRISFDFGPTLLAWLENKAPDVYQAILTADKESQRFFSGHGSAMAQAYNHMILPMANQRDKYTQVLWGIRDFEHRFSRSPEGMWLPETAVDLETLDIIAQMGIKFTILAPRQASRVRRLGEESWQTVTEGSINITMPYEIHLPSGHKMALFLYNGAVASAVAFQGLPSSGETFANRLVNLFSEEPAPQLAHIATDGESYGHHHRFGDMALAYALHYIENHNLAQITNYGEFLDRHPPAYEMEILENTSWSCAHGVERWRSDCGCSDHKHPGWNQAWRAPLREAMDWLRDETSPGFEDKARRFFKDPRQARNNYISVILDRSPESVRRFLDTNATHKLNKAETVTAIKLMGLQRHTMLMYTSCGWFFDDIARIESVQIIQYAARVIQLAEELFGGGFETHFLELLEKAQSNIPEYGDGRQIYERFVRPAMVDLKRVVADFTMISLFEAQADSTQIYCYRIDINDYQRLDCGQSKIAVGQVKVVSGITGESLLVAFGVMNTEKLGLKAGVREFKGLKSYETMVDEITEACSLADDSGVALLLEKHFGSSAYSFTTLFRDEQHRVLDKILDAHLSKDDVIYQQIHKSHYTLTPLGDELDNPLPGTLHTVAEFILNRKLNRALMTETDTQVINNLFNEARRDKVNLDKEGLGYAFSKLLERKMAECTLTSDDTALMDEMIALIDAAYASGLPVNLHRVQYLYYQLLKTVYPSFRDETRENGPIVLEVVSKFTLMGEKLHVRVD